MGDGALQIASLKQASPRVSREGSGLKAGFLLADLGTGLALSGRSLTVAELPQHRSQGGMRSRKVRLQAYRFPECVGCFRQFVHLLEHRTQRVEGLGVVRLHSDGVLQLLNRGREITGLPQCDSVGVVGVCQLRVESDRLF